MFCIILNISFSFTGIEEVEEEDLGLLKEQIRPRRKIPTLLKRLNERLPENIDYLGTSYGLTQELLKFWKSLCFVPVYLSQKANDLTGEHSCIMLHTLNKSAGTTQKVNAEWLGLYFNDFRRRVIKLMSKTFREFSTSLVLSLLDNKWVKVQQEAMDKQVLDNYFLPHDLQRLESYSRNQIEYRLILDLTTDISYLYFQGKLSDLPIDTLQKAVLLAIGIQGKTVDDIAGELNMPGNQLLAKFYDLIKKTSKYFSNIVEGHIESTMISETKLKRGDDFEPITLSLNDELEETAKQITKKQKDDLQRLKKESLKEFAIKGSDEDWSKALSGKEVNAKMISVKRYVVFAYIYTYI